MTHSSYNNNHMYFSEDFDYRNYYLPSPRDDPLAKFKRRRPVVPSINYMNERQCPIYVHDIKTNSSVWNNYNNKPAPKKPLDRTVPRCMLNKLEESYWATWKPKREPVAFTRSSPRPKNDKQQVDCGDNIIKHFKASNFNSSTKSVLHKKSRSVSPSASFFLLPENKSGPLDRPSNARCIIRRREVASKEEVPPPILPVKEVEQEPSEVKPITLEETKIDPRSKKGKKIKKPKKEGEKFVELKDSLEILKKKQSKPREHFQQPKCIKLFKKTGITPSLLKGGTYPLKSCLKKDGIGNFRLGAPGSPLFVTTSSFTAKKK